MKAAVIDFMNVDPIKVKPWDSLKHVLHTIDTYEVSHLLVVDNGILLGVVSKSDLLRATRDIINQSSGTRYSDILLETIKAEEIMGKELVTIQYDESIDEAIHLFMKTGIHCLPVMDCAIPIGIITYYDVLKHSKPDILNPIINSYYE